MEEKYFSKDPWKELLEKQWELCQAVLKGELDVKMVIEKIQEIIESQGPVIKALSPKGEEIIFDFKKIRKEWEFFYNSHNLKVKIPKIKFTDKETEEIKKLVELGIVDSCAIIANFSYLEIVEKLVKRYGKTWLSDDFMREEGFSTLEKLEPEKISIVFYKKVKELEEDDFLKETIGKSPEEMRTFLEKLEKEKGLKLEGFSLKEYLIVQRKFVEEMKDFELQDPQRHLDARNFCWCLKSRFSSRVVCVHWCSKELELDILAYFSSFRIINGGSRLCRVFDLTE